MTNEEMLKRIQEMIIILSGEPDVSRTLSVIHSYLDFRICSHYDNIRNINDLFYFLCGIMFSKGISDYWNGRNKGEQKK